MPSDGTFFNGYYTRSFTIPSKYPSWWEGNQLIQEPLYDSNERKLIGFTEIASELGIAGNRHVENRLLVNEYGKEAPKETVFLSDVLSFGNCCENNKIDDVGRKVFSDKIYEKLLKICRQYPEYFSAGNIGYDLCKKTLIGIL